MAHASRILVVDSDSDHAERCRAALTGAGFEVVVSADASDALTAFAAAPVDALLVETPTAGDVAALRTRAAVNGATVVTMTSVFLGPSNREIEVGLYGSADLLAKPVDPRDVLSWLERSLGDRFPSSAEGEPSEWGQVPTQLTPHPPVEAVPSAARVELGDVAAPAPETDLRSALAAETKPVKPVAEAELLAKSRTQQDTPIVDETERGGMTLGEDPIEESAPSRPITAPLAPPPGLAVPEALDVTGLERSGDLAKTPVATVIARFARSSSTGVLELRSADGERAVYYDNGRVVGVTSTRAEDALSAILSADGVVRADQVDAIARNLGAEVVDDEATYVDAGLIDRADLGPLRAFVARRRLASVFAWEEGDWRFTAEPPPRSVRVGIERSPIELIWEGAQHVVPPAQVRSVLSGWMGRAPAWVTQPPSRTDIELTRWQRAIVGSIDGETVASEVLLGSPDRNLAQALLYTLVVCGFVGFSS